MRCCLIYIIFFIGVNSFGQLPEGFIYAKDVIPDLVVELRYFSSNNFVGAPIDGYTSNRLILTNEAVKALKKVQDELEMQNLCLKVFDAYRPQRAVDHFVRWARDLGDTINKTKFYPKVDKQNLFKEGFIATKSGHTRGSTLDLTIIDANTSIPLDMGSPYDFFGEKSWVYCDGISNAVKANRKLLQEVMAKYGFVSYPQEWWHFTLGNEPFPDTYFDFVIQ